MAQHFRCKQATCRCHELHAPGRHSGRSMHVRTRVFCTYSDRHELGLLPCAGGVALCFAVLCCARGSTAYILVHTAVLLFVAAYLVRIYRSRMFVAVKKTMENEDSRCIKCSKTCMLALANSARLLALSPGMHERENSAKHDTARHSTAPV